jgi:sialate O-acetylesterase
MEMALKKSLNWTQETKIVSDFVNVRFCRLNVEYQKNSSFHFTDHDDLTENLVIPWSAPENPYRVGELSAVCWYFGKEVNKRLNVPIGLIQATCGGTSLDRWITAATYNECLGKENKSLDVSKQYEIETPRRQKHSRKWPTMIYPLTSMSIYGVIVYQGESDALMKPNLFVCSFIGLISDWRRTWFVRSNRSTSLQFPFGLVQLQSFYQSGKSKILSDTWIRFHQTGMMFHLTKSV